MIAARSVRIPLLLVMVCFVSQRVHAEERSASQLEQDLIAFAWRGDIQRVRSLIDRDVDPNAKDEFGQSVLHRAVMGGNLDVVKLLLKKDANPNAISKDGETVLESVGGRLSKEVIQLLLAADVQPTGKSLWKACWLGNQDIVNLLIEAGVTMEEGLAGAAQGGHVQIVKLLIDRGSDVNFKREGGYTALQVGALQGGPDVVRLLLAAGAKPNIMDDRGRTALHTAVTGDGNLEVVKQLIAAGAKPNVADNEGLTPLREAGMRGGEVYQFLLAGNGGDETMVLPDDANDDQKSTKELIAALSHKDRKARQAAELALLARGKGILPEVSSAMDDDDESLGPLLSLLTKMGPSAEPLFPKLEALLVNPKHVFSVYFCMEQIKPGMIRKLSPEVRSKAAEAHYQALIDPVNSQSAGFFVKMLPSYGEPATRFILKLLRSEQPGYRIAGAKCLAVSAYHDNELEQELIKLIDGDLEYSVRGLAARAVWNPLYHNDDCRLALTRLVEKLSSQQNYGAQQAVRRATESLATFGKSAITDLVPLVEKGGDEYRISAVNTWRSLPAEANDELADLLEHRSPNVVLAARVVLADRGPEAAAVVAAKLSSKDEAVRRHAANILSKIRGANDDAVPQLVEIAGNHDQSDLTRMAAARAALVLNNRAALQSESINSLIPTLTTALNDKFFQVRGDAAQTLGLMGSAAKSAIPDLEKTSKMSGQEVGADNNSGIYPRERAKQAIELIMGRK